MFPNCARRARYAALRFFPVESPNARSLHLPPTAMSFGPSAHGSQRDFDFTLLFEQSILAIPPPALCLPLAVWRIWKLRARRVRVQGRLVLASKLVRTRSLSILFHVTCSSRSGHLLPSGCLTIGLADTVVEEPPGANRSIDSCSGP